LLLAGLAACGGPAPTPLQSQYQRETERALRYHARGELSRALAAWQESLRWAEVADDRPAMLAQELNVGALALALGDWALAERSFQRAQLMAAALSDSVNESRARLGLAQVSLRQGRFGDARWAFQQVLDEAGLIIAKGDRRDFVIVDEAGEVHSLARQIRGVTTKDLRAFMADLDREALPTVEEAKAIHKGRPAQEPSPLADAPETARPADGGSEGVSLDEALRAWHAEDMRRLTEFHATELDRRAVMLDEKIAARLEKSDARRVEALVHYDAQAERRGLARVVDQVIGLLAPAWAERRQTARDEARNTAIKALDRERAQEEARLESAKQTELADLAERQAGQARERETQFTEELTRRVRDYEEAQRFAAQLAEQERQRQEAIQQSHSAGPEPPTRAR